MDKFLEKLETEVRRQGKSQAILSSTSTAMAISHQPAAPSGPKKKGKRPFCSGGVHNPETSHTKDDCHQVHPEKAITYHQATARENPQAHLRTEADLSDTIILDSGAWRWHGRYLSDFHETCFKVLVLKENQYVISSYHQVPLGLE
jgi:hypothetical protein